MDTYSVTVNVVIDANIYYRFYKFEKFTRTHGLIKLVFFASFMSALACLSLVRSEIFLGVTLLVIGLGLPAVNVWNFFRTIKIHVNAIGSDSGIPVYSLKFYDSPDGIEVTNHGEGDEPLHYEWDTIHAVYRVDDCIYFYVLPNKAFLLPDGQALEGTEALWDIIVKMVQSEKIRDKRKK